MRYGIPMAIYYFLLSNINQWLQIITVNTTNVTTTTSTSSSSSSTSTTTTNTLTTLASNGNNEASTVVALSQVSQLEEEYNIDYSWNEKFFAFKLGPTWFLEVLLILSFLYSSFVEISEKEKEKLSQLQSPSLLASTAKTMSTTATTTATTEAAVTATTSITTITSASTTKSSYRIPFPRGGELFVYTFFLGLLQAIAVAPNVQFSPFGVPNAQGGIVQDIVFFVCGCIAKENGWLEYILSLPQRKVNMLIPFIIVRVTYFLNGCI